MLACAVLVGLVLNAALGWWWADPAAGLVIIYYAIKEARTIIKSQSSSTCVAPSGFEPPLPP